MAASDANRVSSSIFAQTERKKSKRFPVCSRSKFLSKILKILVKNFPEIFPEFFFYSFANFNEKNSNLGGVKIIPEGSGAATKYYAQLGADATSKKLLGIELIKLGSEAGTYDLSSYTGWESFSGNNFLITSKAYAASASYGNNGRPFGTNTTSSEPVKTYENGILTVSESDTGEIWDSNKQYYIRAATIVTGVYLIY